MRMGHGRPCSRFSAAKFNAARHWAARLAPDKSVVLAALGKVVDRVVDKPVRLVPDKPVH